MTALQKTLAALALVGVALPTATLAQGLVRTEPSTMIAAAIADLDGRLQDVSPAQAAAFGLPALPSGESYGLKDSRIVVLDASGAVTDIVRVVADFSTTAS